MGTSLNPSFIAKQEHPQKNPSLLVNHRDRITKETVISLHPLSNDGGVNSGLHLDIPCFKVDMQEMKILGACSINGVICLYNRPILVSNQHPNDDLYRIALWNPTTRHYKKKCLLATKNL